MLHDVQHDTNCVLDNIYIIAKIYRIGIVWKILLNCYHEKSLPVGEAYEWGGVYCSPLTSHRSLLVEAVEAHLEIHLVGAEHLTGLAAVDGAYDTGFLELVHDASSTVVADRELTLDE